jgi:hypothetical protein
MVHVLHHQGRWLLCGYWNIVELQMDKSTPIGRILTGAKKLKFEIFKVHLEVCNLFKHNQQLIYTWNNRRTGAACVLARLDLIYTFSNPHSNAAKYVTKHRI